MLTLVKAGHNTAFILTPARLAQVHEHHRTQLHWISCHPHHRTFPARRYDGATWTGTGGRVGWSGSDIGQFSGNGVCVYMPPECKVVVY